MEQRNDLILREIEKLGLVLKKLIKNIHNADSKEIETEINQINETLTSEFNISISSIIKLDNEALLKNINNLHESHLEKLAKLLHEVIKKMNQENKDYGLNRKELTKKAILLIDYIDSNSTTFSIDRMHLKNSLQLQTDVF
ncbi:hypothetical protein MKD41_14540 [Lutibacter sp. A64]|uniref:hypothetical protein n=1 Tax=Lutibacter sp. A64 TaxID=2918526 RepID=UPI001F068CA6|nr:hypothetical protein [Lutibacter sp. A64]UMB53542.1 hypothetical protein MKD41_14540 [Lutibacter sp. A64]